MTMWARIENNTVAEITEIDPAGRFHASLLWESCSAEVQPGWLYDGQAFSPPAVEPLIVTTDDVDAERDRRIDAGVEFQGALYQSRADDRENIAGSAQLAFMAIVQGAQPGDLRWATPEADFFWIALDNSRVPMDAQTVVEFGKLAALSKQAHIIAGSNLKQMEPIPANYNDNKWWP